MQVSLWLFLSRMSIIIDYTMAVMEVYRPSSRLQLVVDFESFSSKNLKFPSVMSWYIDGKDISEISTYQCPSQFTCSGKKFVKDFVFCLETFLQKR